MPSSQKRRSTSRGFALALLTCLLAATLAPNVNADSAPSFKHWPHGLDFPNCERFLSGQQYQRAERRLRLNDDTIGDIGSSCDEVLSRGYYPSSALSEAEADFPIAFANNVFKV